MTDLQKEFEATGYTSWINLDLYPDGKIYTQEYTQWLEKQVLALRKTGVIGAVALLKFLQEEQQKQYSDAKDYMTADKHQYYEEGCNAVLQLIEMRFGN